MLRGFCVLGLKLSSQSLWYGVGVAEFIVWGLSLRVYGVGGWFRFPGLMLGVLGSGFRVYGTVQGQVFGV